MLTDAEARDLLHAAADTIDVEPAAPLPVVQRPTIWPMLVAAAAVIAIVVTTFALTDRGSTPPPVAPPSPTPTLDADQIPPVMGLDPEAAAHLLRERGLDVTVVSQDECVDAQVVAGDSPPVGARFRPGQSVTITILIPDRMAFCVLPDTWGLLRFALGLAPPPLFADEVTLYAGQANPVTLSSAEAADPARWEVCDGSECASALAVLAERASAPSVNGGTPWFSAGHVDAVYGDADPCADGPRTVGGLSAYRFLIEEPTDGFSLCANAVVYYDENNRIAAVGVPLGPVAPSDEPLPEVAAHEFVEWARGSGVPPSFADEVDLYLGNVLQRAVPAAEAATFTGLDLACESYASRPCPASAFDALGGTDPVVLNQLHPDDVGGRCKVVLGDLPASLVNDDALAGAVQIDRSGPPSCGDRVTVQLWLDGDEIYAVNLIYGDPCAGGGDCTAEPTPEAERVGQMFLEFARGEHDGLPVDTPVDLYLDGNKMRTISSVDARDPAAWVPCLEFVSNCPPSMTSFVAQPGAVPMTASLPEGGCRPVNPGALPWTPDVTLTWRTFCQDWFAVQLSINDVGQITAANLVTAR